MKEKVPKEMLQLAARESHLVGGDVEESSPL